jgi:hypothetical protein
VIFVLRLNCNNKHIVKDSWDKFLGIINRSHETVKGWIEDDLRRVLNSVELSSLSALEKVDVIYFWKTLQGINMTFCSTPCPKPSSPPLLARFCIH